MAHLRSMLRNDWDAVRAIYQQGIDSGVATFETEVPDWKTWHHSHIEQGRLVALDDGTILGWAALSPVSHRCVYQGVAEVSIYVATDAREQGIGKQLLTKLISISEDLNIWTLEAVILEPNDASVRLHTVCGFRKVGYRERIGKQNGKWLNTILMERRSAVVGTD